MKNLSMKSQWESMPSDGDPAAHADGYVPGAVSERPGAAVDSRGMGGCMVCHSCFHCCKALRENEIVIPD